MTPASVPRRSPLFSALILAMVLLLFGAATFVAGIVLGGGTAIGQVGDSGSPQPSVTVPSAPATPPGPTPVLETVTCAEPSEAFVVLCDAYAQIKADYVDDVSDEDLVEGAVRGMVEYGLQDPYSGYLPPEIYSSALDDLSGEFSGIGAEVGVENLADPDDLISCTVITQVCAMVIVAPLSGSPAEAAGLRSGDRVLAVDGMSTIGESLSSMVFQVRGEAGTDVTLTIERDGETMDITITRAVIDLREVEAELLDGGIAYIYLTAFTDRSPSLFRDALGSMLDQGATRIVFDLRDNPGGFLTASQDIASEFVPAGEVLFTVESDGEVDRFPSKPGGLAQGDAFEVVVLVNGGSASASEIVAAALQEHDRATIVGEATFGKNTVQIWRDLPNGGGLRLTTDRWFTPDHNSVAPDGIQPDIVVEAPEDPSGDEDPQLERAVELLGG